MPLLQSPPTPYHPLPFSKYLSGPKHFTIFSTKHSKFPIKKSITISSCSPPEALHPTELEILESIAEFDGEKETKNLPGVRIYENDLAQLTLIGDVSFEQALTAAAADGGEAADEHILSGISTMVVETVFPGPSDEQSTISTRLFLPSKKVKEKARKLRNTLPADMLSSTTSRNILAMTFRQVVLQKIWSFQLALFSPGAQRDMEDLENRREVPTLFTISSSDEQVLSVLAEVVCKSALESTERDFHENSLGTSSNNIFNWFQKPRRIASKDCSVFICKIQQDEILENAKTSLKNFKGRPNYSSREMKRKHCWWTSSTYSKLEKIGGPGFSKWASEYIPAYRLQIDADKLKNVKLDCWKKSAENRWEVLLTHSQMVGLVEILDMYYEDLYTLPDKQLSCGVLADYTNLTKNKRSTSVWKLLPLALASGLFVVSVSILTRLYWPHLRKAKMSPTTNSSVSLSETSYYQHHSLEATKVEELCISIVKKIKDSVGWPGEIVTDKDLGAWTGELPSYLRRLSDLNLVQEVTSCNGEDTETQPIGEAPVDLSSSVASLSDKSNTDMETKSAQDIASYQVVLSKDGDIIGFQPTSRVAVNYWAMNPLAKELYKGKKLSPGFIEPGLKIPCPNEIVLLELLMSVNPESWFVLARPIQ
ncbi:hypothetical protein BVC80_1741g79 [Macleaya cordata]|uniref:Uncharacterized protein n=1 Tax=Macleaya cordata TaxID=56857 RepID=A0A200QKN5_MACCD|nr:hypothetical protein BVC80_1741g79 [Macleaya cordata]